MGITIGIEVSVFSGKYCCISYFCCDIYVLDFFLPINDKGISIYVLRIFFADYDKGLNFQDSRFAS